MHLESRFIAINTSVVDAPVDAFISNIHNETCRYMQNSKTLYDKLIDSHTVRELDDEGHVLLYIDRQVLNEYTSPQAFSGLREAGRAHRRTPE